MDLLETSPSLKQRHPWETSRCRFFLSLLESAGGVQKSDRWLDIGSGDAWFSDQLIRRFGESVAITCWDKEYHPNHTLPAPLKHPTRISLTRERPSDAYDGILMLDVLEHVENDRDFLLSIVSQNLKSRGLLLMSVPAWPLLFSHHDQELKHFRRYRPFEGLQVLQAVGLKIIQRGGLFHALMIPRFLSVPWRKSDTHPGHRNLGNWNHGRGMTSLVRWGLDMDNLGSRTFARLGWNIPGLSWWALCQKP